MAQISVDWLQQPLVNNPTWFIYICITLLQEYFSFLFNVLHEIYDIVK